jgi:hypothetical protein
MTFEEILDQAMAMLQRRGRVTYRTVQRQFQLDEVTLNDLKDALLYAHPEVHDDAGRGLIWTGAPGPLLQPPQLQQGYLRRRRSPTPRPIWPRRSSPRAVPWKASASSLPSCLRTSKARWSCWPTAIQKRPDSSSTRC